MQALKNVVAALLLCLLALGPVQLSFDAHGGESSTVAVRAGVGPIHIQDHLSANRRLIPIHTALVRAREFPGRGDSEAYASKNSDPLIAQSHVRHARRVPRMEAGDPPRS